MKHYQADEFILDTKADTMEVAVDKKVSLLYELYILSCEHGFKDNREDALRQVLANYKSEHSLTTALHDIVVGNESIDTFLAQKEMIQ